MSLPKLEKNDEVIIIAPASKAAPEDLNASQELLRSWGLKVHSPPDLFGEDLLCANSDKIRFAHLQEALSYKAIFAIRGGYGSMRLIPYLNQLSKQKPRLFIGMSDCTALHLFFQKHWHWSTIHSGLSPKKFATSSLALLKNLLFQENLPITYPLEPINKAAFQQQLIKTTCTGGNLTLVQASIGTIWQMNTENKIVFLEEINECAYRIDRMLTHLWQAGILYKAKALIFGDFIQKQDEPELINSILGRFAKYCPFPVLKVANIGHGKINNPLPLNTMVTLNIGNYEPILELY